MSRPYHEESCTCTGTRYNQTAAFCLNMLNDPRGREGGWWTSDLFKYGTLGELAVKWILQVDPAVTTKRRSDWTALAVIAFMPPTREHPHGRVEVVWCKKVKLVAGPFRKLVLNVLEWFPQIRGVRVEANQGGELWVGDFQEPPRGVQPPFVVPKEGSILHGLPVRVQIHSSSLPKEVRLARLLSWYQRPGDVILHRKRFTSLENTMISYPNVAFDDEPDAVALGVNYFLEPPKKGKAGGISLPYG